MSISQQSDQRSDNFGISLNKFSLYEHLLHMKFDLWHRFISKLECKVHSKQNLPKYKRSITFLCFFVICNGDYLVQCTEVLSLFVLSLVDIDSMYIDYLTLTVTALI